MDPLPPMTEKEQYWVDRMLAAQHAMQTGVLATIHKRGPCEGPGWSNDAMTHESSPKHLRVGVNTAMVDQQGLVMLLLEKKIITREEYFEKLALCHEAEAQRYSEALGVELL